MFDGSFLDYVTILPFTYLLISIGEWVYHRYAMHQPLSETLGISKIKHIEEISGRHVAHHSLTNKDMSINEWTVKNSKKNNKKYSKDLTQLFQGHNVMEEFQNLYFVWPNTVAVILALYLGLVIFNAVLFGISGYYLLLVSIGVGLLHAALWNCVHPMLHYHERGLKWFEGFDVIDRKWFHETAWYRFLWKNHVLHHLCTGKDSCNFNIAFPLADVLFGTFRSSYYKFKLDTSKFTIMGLE